jgi:hypothetical protein
VTISRASGLFFDICIESKGLQFRSRSRTKNCGQVAKGVRWMPWHQQAKKDVISCDKLRVAANTL